jgi:peptidoglycan/xylan/chitin deacetylase (PgdA/CDA1 family)
MQEKSHGAFSWLPYRIIVFYSLSISSAVAMFVIGCSRNLLKAPSEYAAPYASGIAFGASRAASSRRGDPTPLPASMPAWRSSRFTWDHGGIVRGDRSRRELALVFTADEFGEGTSHVLGVLAEKKVTASFFLTGKYLRNPLYRPLVRRMLASGHYVGPHSNSHPLYCSWEDRNKTLITREQFRDDLEANLRELESLGWQRPSPFVYYIPPYEWYNDDQARWALEMGVRMFNLTPGIGTNRDYIPESQPSFRASRQIFQEALQHETRDPAGLNGDILLLHLGANRSDKLYLLLDELIDELQKRGYRLSRIDVLLGS